MSPILDGNPRTSVWRTRAANAQRDPQFMTPVKVQMWSQSGSGRAFVVMHKTAGRVVLPKSKVVQDEVQPLIFNIPNWLIWDRGIAPHPYR
jgi:hypothetical protein